MNGKMWHTMLTIFFTFTIGTWLDILNILYFVKKIVLLVGVWFYLFRLCILNELFTLNVVDLTYVFLVITHYCTNLIFESSNHFLDLVFFTFEILLI